MTTTVFIRRHDLHELWIALKILHAEGHRREIRPSLGKMMRPLDR